MYSAAINFTEKLADSLTQKVFTSDFHTGPTQIAYQSKVLPD